MQMWTCLIPHLGHTVNFNKDINNRRKLILFIYLIYFIKYWCVSKFACHQLYAAELWADVRIEWIQGLNRSELIFFQELPGWQMLSYQNL